MSQLLTIEKSNPDFLNYLRGSFSKSQRAIPVSIQKDQLTFRLVEKNQIERPHILEVLSQLLRLEYLTFSLMPMLVLLGWAYFSGWQTSTFLISSVFLAVLLFQVSAHFFSEYFDHMKGVDHIHWRGSQVIQKGWLTAYQVQNLACLTLFFSVICALPVLLQNFYLLLILAVLSFLAMIEFSSNRFGFKYLGFGEFSIFLLTGPLLSAGFTWAVWQQVSVETLFIGFIFGLTSSYVYFLKNFEEISIKEDSHLLTLANRVGFDRSQSFAMWFPPLLLVVCLFFGELLTFVPKVWRIYFLLSAPLCLWVLFEVKKVESCLSSNLLRVKNKGLVFHFLSGLMILLSLVATKYLN